MTINGLDVYDPTTGPVRSSTTDDIACWFIDTNYNGEAFFVRHAYFTGGSDDPYDALKKACKAEINAEAWEALYRTESSRSPPPAPARSPSRSSTTSETKPLPRLHRLAGC